MGTRLIEEVLDHSPADLTPAERMILIVLARHANDQTRECWPSIDTIARQTGIQAGSVSKALQRLGKRGLEVRIPVGFDKRGCPVFAHKGHKTTYRVPVFEQRADQVPTFEGGQRADHGPTKDSKGGPGSNLQGVKGRTTVPQRADHGLPLTVKEPSQEELPKDSSLVAAASAATEVPQPNHHLEAFGAFWIVFPKKRAREEAKKAWIAAIGRGADPQHIVDAATGYAKERAGEDAKYTKYPATWLNKGCYDDEPDPQPGRPQLRAVGDYQPWRNPEDSSGYHDPL